MSDQHHAQTWVQETWRPGRFESADPRLKQLTYNEQVLGLYQLSHYGLPTTMVIGSLVAGIFALRNGIWPILPWLGVLLAVALIRFRVSSAFFTRNPPPEQLPRWARFATIGSGVQGVVWALLPLIVDQSGSGTDLALAAFIAAGFGFGSLATLGAYLPAFLAFSLPILGVQIVLFASGGGIADVLGAVVVLLFTITMCMAVMTASKTLRSSILARHENRELIRVLSDEKERVQVTLESIGDGVLTTDVQGRVTYLNPAAELMTGWSAEDARGRPLREVVTLVTEQERLPVPDLGAQCLERAAVVAPDGDCLLLDRYGAREFAVEVSVAPIRDDAREVIGTVVVMHDVTELRKMARVMSYQANHDPLTGLVNRREFERRLRYVIEGLAHESSHHALCYMDLDQFKVVNDTCGHTAGDFLLKQLAGVLRSHVRESDTLARLGGDEFGLLLTGCPLHKAREIAEGLCDAIRNFRFAWEDKVFNVGVSIGIAAVDKTSTPTDVLVAADSACYLAKDAGRNRVHVFDPDDRELANRHGEMQLISQIQRALDEDRFELRYQKIVPLRPGLGLHAEILLTMIAADGSRLSPGVFLPAAERYSMMSGVDRWVIRRAFRQLAGGAAVLSEVEQLAINLSGQSMSQEELVDFVLQELDAVGLDPRRICFEITETAVIANLNKAKHFIRVLREKGCRFALDDFGSGLSSFGYLRSLQVDYLKIDGAFVRHVSQDPIDRAMVTSINELGHVMGIKTIAEFVEDEEAMELLRNLGVDYAQGYHVHRPEVLA